MPKVTSQDGTEIAYDKQGQGPAVILVGGGLDDGTELAPLVPELAAKQFTVFNYARRGRGKSGDTQPYAVEREVEDIEALIAEAGGLASLYGVSSGGALALEAVAAGLSGVDKVGVYEVPYNIAEDWPGKWRKYKEDIQTAFAAGRRDEVIEAFMRLTGSSNEEIEGLKSSPYWEPMISLVHTLLYDADCLGNGQPPVSRFARITQPTLVATGTDARQPGAAVWVLALDDAADAIAASIPNAKRQVLEGQSHVADPKAVALVLERFFKG